MYCVTITDAHLDTLQWVSLIYYLRETNRENGLVADKTMPGSPSSIAAVGLALAAAPVVVERESWTARRPPSIVLKKLRFFRDSPQGPEPDATGYKGFYYHFLDMKTGRRVWNCELSTMDSAFLIAGMLTAAAYFDRDDAGRGRDPRDRRRPLSPGRLGLGRRRRAAITHGWRPETGFIPYRYEGYDEGLLLYLLALGSPTYPSRPRATPPGPRPSSGRRFTASNTSTRARSSPTSFRTCSSTSGASRSLHGVAGDRLLREHPPGHLRPARIRDPEPPGIRDVRRNLLGLHRLRRSGMDHRTIQGIERQFFDYIARGAPFGPDDGTIAPWVVVASLPFAPEIVLPTIQHFNALDLGMTDSYGFKTSFNPTYEIAGSHCGWVSPCYFGIDQGPLVLMIENYRSGLLWSITKRCPYIVAGLRRAGFRGGWL